MLLISLANKVVGLHTLCAKKCEYLVQL